MKPAVLGIVIVLALLAAGAIFFVGNTPPPTVPAEQSYVNEVYGISFTYPVGYILSEDNASKDGAERYSITLIREEDAIPRTISKGPTAVTVDIYGDAAVDGSVSAWLSTMESNFGISDGTYASTTVSGADAVRYQWSGLYEGETTAIVHGDDVIAVSVTYMSPSDAIYADYLALLTSLQLR